MQKSIKEEIKFLEGKLEKNPDSILFARLADAYLQVDRIDDAIELCENSIKKHPFYVTGHHVLAKIYLKKKLFDQAEKELKRVLLFDPKYISAHRNYGELMLQIGWGNTCEKSFEEILQIDPFNEKARQRFNELKDHSPLPKEQPKKVQQVTDYDVLEENMLSDIPQAIEDEEPLPPKIEPEQHFTHAKSKNFFAEDSMNDFEDEQANLDMLEDIFRNDVGTDFKLENDIERDIKPAQPQKPDPSFDITEPKFLSRQKAPDNQFEEFESEYFDGLEDDEILSLMSDEKEPPKQEPEPAEIEPETKPQKQYDYEPPQPSKPVEKLDSGDADKRKEKIVTPTLGEIYAAQQQYSKAIGVYEILRRKDPDNQLYKQKIEYLQKKLEESHEN